GWHRERSLAGHPRLTRNTHDGRDGNHGTLDCISHVSLKRALRRGEGVGCETKPYFDWLVQDEARKRNPNPGPGTGASVRIVDAHLLDELFVALHGLSPSRHSAGWSDSGWSSSLGWGAVDWGA